MVRTLRNFFVFSAAFALFAALSSGQDLLPDLIYDETVFNVAIVDTVEEGRIHLLLDSAIVNVGTGPLLVDTDGDAQGDDFEPTSQVIKQEDGSERRRPLGNMTYHPLNKHLFVSEGWSEYRLRRILPGDGVGDVLAEGEKTDFCMVDSRVFDDTLPNFDPIPRQRRCSPPQGIDVGWLDLYTKTFPNQWIDITGLPKGFYWLEAEVDRVDHLLEIDETNNIGRVKVFLDSDLLEPFPTDVDEDGATNSADLQRTVNAVIRVTEDPLADINGDGKTNALDVQRVLIAIVESAANEG